VSTIRSNIGESPNSKALVGTLIYATFTWPCFRSDVGRKELALQHQREGARLESLKASDRMQDWAKRHQYSILGGSWAASMALASAIVMRDRFGLSITSLPFGLSVLI
jgi:hypothetical protein